MPRGGCWSAQSPPGSPYGKEFFGPGQDIRPVLRLCLALQPGGDNATGQGAEPGLPHWRRFKAWKDADLPVVDKPRRDKT
jgi:hypothetical protein